MTKYPIGPSSTLQGPTALPSVFIASVLLKASKHRLRKSVLIIKQTDVHENDSTYTICQSLYAVPYNSRYLRIDS